MIHRSAAQTLSEALGASLPRARFRADVAVGPYVAAFLSRPAALIVEIDHGEPADARSAARTRFLNGQGYRIIRFWHEDVRRDPAAILDALACAMPPECLDGSGASCRIGAAAARAEWSPRPDFPPRAQRSRRPARPATFAAGEQ